MHECVLTATPLKNKYGVRGLDVAKALLEEGFHSPTVYFPLIVEEALMFEPTETESLQTSKPWPRRWSESRNGPLTIRTPCTEPRRRRPYHASTRRARRAT